MPLKVPSIRPIAIVSDDAQAAAQFSCLIGVKGSYVAVIDGPRMGRDDRQAEVTRRRNTLARSGAETVLLGPMPVEARTALQADLPRRFCRVADRWEDVHDVAADRQRLEREPLVWGRDRIGIGTLKALTEGRRIEFVDKPSPVENVPATNHLVVCEEGHPLSEVIAANYAFALRAGLTLIPQVPAEIADELLEGLYSLQDAGDFSPTQRLQIITERIFSFCADVKAPAGGSITFITNALPFGIAHAYAPTTHLFTYPDLGISVVNGIAAEQAKKPGVEIAVLIDPGSEPAPEIDAAAKILAKRRVFVRGYSERGASVRAVTEAVELFPYDLLIFATHCGDADGYRWTYEFKDYEEVPRTLVVDIALGLGRTDDADVLDVMQFMRFHSLDGVSWTDPKKSEKVTVGSAIRYFVDKEAKDKIEPVKKEEIERVNGSAAMKMFDDNYLAMPRNLGNKATPIIINNACVSWRDLAKRFMFADCRAYIGTLYPIVPTEADAVMMATIEKQFEKELPHAIWSAQNSVYKDSWRRPYVVSGVYCQRFRFGSKDAPDRILAEMTEAKQYWTSRVPELAKEGASNSIVKRTEATVEFYSKEMAAFTKRWPRRPNGRR